MNSLDRPIFLLQETRKTPLSFTFLFTSILFCTNSKFAHQGIGSKVLGDPKIALTWLVNELSQNNILLEKELIIMDS